MATMKEAKAVTKHKHSKLYRHIEEQQGARPFGALLDAGTGANSLRWVVSLKTDRWTAITGSAQEADIARDAIGGAQRPQDQIVLGNWADERLLAGAAFDTVIADYLLGAVEGFAPYYQNYLFSRLRPLTRSALYVIGLEPYVPTARPQTESARLLWEIGRFRDACVLLKGGLPYREYPAQWVRDELKLAGFSVKSVEHFKISFKHLFVDAQINIAVHGLDRLGDPALVSALKARGESLRSHAQQLIARDGALRGCRNYVIAAEPV